MLRQALHRFLGIIPTLDLHGLKVQPALQETEAFLRQAQALRTPVVRIIYGKGHGSPGGIGILRQVIPDWLDAKSPELVLRYERQLDQSGHDGGVRVWLRVDSKPELP